MLTLLTLFVWALFIGMVYAAWLTVQDMRDDYDDIFGAVEIYDTKADVVYTWDFENKKWNMKKIDDIFGGKG